MNILWIYNLPLIPEAGGTERITSILSNGFSMRGHNSLGVLVFEEQTGDMVFGTSPVVNLYEFLRENSVDIVINQIAYADWLLKLFLQKGGRRWHREGGCIVSCLHFDPQNPSLLYLLNGKVRKNVYDYLMVFKAFVFQKYYKRKQQKQERNIYNYIYENSDWFVVLSGTHFPYLYKVMARPEYKRLVAISNPLTFEDISGSEILETKKKVVLVCARMSEYHKRISIILRAWKVIQMKKEANDWVLILLGEGPDLQRYKDFVLENRLSNVRFEGRQSSEPYYRQASILLLASCSEGWGLAITEGLQRAVVPVVMNSCPVFQEIIQDGYNGYLTPNNNINLYTDRLFHLMSDPLMLRQMQLNALESAKNFSLDKTMDKWIELVTLSEPNGTHAGRSKEIDKKCQN